MSFPFERRKSQRLLLLLRQDQPGQHYLTCEAHREDMFSHDGSQRTERLTRREREGRAGKESSQLSEGEPIKAV